MKTELSTNEAAAILLDDEFANWSRAAAFALVEYYEALEKDLGESLDLDHIEMRCEWSEYKSASEAYADRYKDSINEVEAIEHFTEQTAIVSFEGGVLVRCC